MERIVDIATDGRHLSAQRGFFVVSENHEEVGRIPLDDITAIIVHAHGITWTTSLCVALAERGAIMVICGSNHAPVAVCLPLDGHHAQNAIIRAQWDAGKSLNKQLWRKVVIAKILWQGAILNANGHISSAFEALAKSVGSGDPKNVEAQAARRYWPLLMGKDFRRDRNEPGTNAMLNYGYTIFRSLCARSVIAAGLHPTIGIHHANRTNAFALADDLMEPLRPLVDALTVRLVAAGHFEITPETKRAFASLIALDIPGENGTTTISGAAIRMAQSLAACFINKTSSDFALPTPPSPAQLSGLSLLVK